MQYPAPMVDCSLTLSFESAACGDAAHRGRMLTKTNRSERHALVAIDGDEFARHQVPWATLRMLLPDIT